MNLNLLFRRCAALAFALLVTSCAEAADLPIADGAAPKEYAGLLKTYVTSGGVRYAAWKQNAADVAALKSVADYYAGTLPPKDRDASLAWHLNAYNAWILQNILAKYPTKGPLAGEPLFFHGNRIVISGKKTSFDHFEQKVIRPTFKEPRVHFALNCASASCPPLAQKPFDAATLEAQLDQLTRAFTNGNPQAIQVSGGSVSLSKIFDWYKDDFAAAGGAVAFINRFRKDPLPAGAKVKFMDYDWSLNEAK
jgi:hypothetical protein